ncbi:MAG: DNA mismatch repair endonuclease MutL, partial [Desulfobulbaceae bacterium]|nr:DNA mismatch repair endonuclease MutL [Desulfobulbaceae bacterium]
DNRTIIDTKGSENLEQRMRDIFSYKNKLLRIEHKNDSAGFHLSGYLLQPEHATTSRTRTLRTLVNSRPVRDRTISYGVSEGLRSFLMKGQQPAGALLLELPSDKLDVNVHPAKREIKFQDPKAVGRFITEAVSLAMQKFQDNMRTEIFTPSPEKQETKLNISPPTPAPKPRPEPTLSPTRPNPPQPTSIFSQKKTASATSKDDKITVYSSTPPETTATELTKEPELKSGLHYLGQLFDLYILCQQEDQLVLIDQHAAHERILYQRLRSTFLNRAIPAQTLLFSQTAELSHEQSDSLEQQRDRVKALGLHVEHFGGTTWVIKAVPAPLTGIDPLDILQEVIDSLQTASPIASQETLPASIDTLLASLACKAAIKSGRKMEKKEIIELLEQMRSTDFFSHCPHGRPVLKIVKKKEIEKWFRRI